MITNALVKDAFDIVKENHSDEESAYIILNSLAILGAKKVTVQRHLDEKSYVSINKYKYPDRLASFLQTTNEKSLAWQGMSFARIALS
jgi:hypothetical protein